MTQFRTWLMSLTLLGMLLGSAMPVVAYVDNGAYTCCSSGENDDAPCPCESKNNCCEKCIVVLRTPCIAEKHSPWICPLLPPRTELVAYLPESGDRSEPPPSPPPEWSC